MNADRLQHIQPLSLCMCVYVMTVAAIGMCVTGRCECDRTKISHDFIGITSHVATTSGHSSYIAVEEVRAAVAATSELVAQLRTLAVMSMRWEFALTFSAAFQFEVFHAKSECRLMVGADDVAACWLAQREPIAVGLLLL